MYRILISTPRGDVKDDTSYDRPEYARTEIHRMRDGAVWNDHRYFVVGDDGYREEVDV